MILSILTTIRSVRLSPRILGVCEPFSYDILLLTVHSAVSFTPCSLTHFFDSILLEGGESLSPMALILVVLIRARTTSPG